MKQAIILSFLFVLGVFIMGCGTTPTSNDSSTTTHHVTFHINYAMVGDTSNVQSVKITRISDNAISMADCAIPCGVTANVKVVLPSSGDYSVELCDMLAGNHNISHAKWNDVSLTAEATYSVVIQSSNATLESKAADSQNDW